MKTVEFVGPAGVGKSTIVGAVIRQLNVPVARREAYRVSSATALLRHPVWAARTLLFVCRAGGLRLLFSKAGANWFAVCGAALQARDLARRDRAVQLYDQLLLQALRRVARETKRSVVELARHYNRLVPLSDLIVAVQVPVAELERRLRARRLPAPADGNGALATRGLAAVAGYPPSPEGAAGQRPLSGAGDRRSVRARP